MAARHVESTAENRGPIVNIVAWITMIAACLATMVKVGIKYSRTRRFEWDDVYMLGAMMAAVAQVVAVAEQVKNGLGRHVAELSRLQLEATERAEYASEFLYIASICLARMAVLQFLATLARTKTRSAVTKAVIGLNLVWAIAAMLAIAFQCRLPRPWKVLSDQCFNQVAFWDVIGAFDIFLDVSMVALPAFLLHDIQTRRRRKVLIVCAFAARLLITPSIILRLLYVQKASNSLDRTYDNVNVSIITELALNLSVIVACVPFSKPFVDYVQSGVLGGGLRVKDSGQHTLESSNDTVLQPLPKARQRPGGGFVLIPESSHAETVVTTGEGSGEGGGSHATSFASDEMIIKQTTGFAVQSEHR